MRKAGIVPSESLEASYKSIAQSRQYGTCDGYLTDVQTKGINKRGEPPIIVIVVKPAVMLFRISLL